MASFLPVLRNGFVAGWDDADNLLDNPHYRGLGPAHLRWMFTTMLMGHYTPVTWLSLGLDYVLWGMNAAGYHLTSLLVHATNGLLVYVLARRLLIAASVPRTAALSFGAAAAALLFAVHPLRVESVAWLSERRDVLVALFYLLAILAYLRYARADAESPTARRRWYWASVALLGLALLSKSMAVSLPAILLVLDVYPLRRLGGSRGWVGSAARAVWLEKAPFVALAAAAGVVQLMATHRVGQLPSFGPLGLGERGAVSLYGVGFYLWKTIAPLDLSPLYLRKISARALTWPLALSGLAVLAVSGIAVAQRRRWPAIGAAWVAYLVVLMPTLGILQTARHLAADRYTYLALISGAVLVGGALAGWLTRAPRRWALGAIAATAVTVAAMAMLTWHQLPIWRDSMALWSHAYALDRSNDIALLNLGELSMRQGDYVDAIRYYSEVVRLVPTLAPAWSNLGRAHVLRSEFDRGEAALRRAIEIEPTNALWWNNLAMFYLRRGEVDRALLTFAQAIAVDPGNRTACENAYRAALQAGVPPRGVEKCQ